MEQGEKKALDFCLKNQDEKNICLSDFAGKWVVLYFYPKDNTPGCTLEAVRFTYFAEQFSALDSTVLGISTDSCESHKRFQEKHNLSVMLLSDPTHDVIKKFNAWKPKTIFGKEFFGTVRTTFIIDPEGNIRYHWPKVKVDGHVEDVIQKLKEIQNNG